MNISDLGHLNDLLTILSIVEDGWKSSDDQFSIAIGWHAPEESVKVAIVGPEKEPAAYDSRYHQSSISLVDVIADITEALNKGRRVSVWLGKEIRNRYLDYHEARGTEPEVEVYQRDLDHEFEFESTTMQW